MAAQLSQGATAGEPKANRDTRGLRGLVSDQSPRDSDSRCRLGPDWKQEEIIFDQKMAAQLWQGATAGEPKANRVTQGLPGLVSDQS